MLKTQLGVVIFGAPGSAHLVQPVADFLKDAGLKTSVGYGAHFADCLNEIRLMKPDVVIFWGDLKLFASVLFHLHKQPDGKRVVGIGLQTSDGTPQTIDLSAPAVLLPASVTASGAVSIVAKIAKILQVMAD